MKRRFTVSIEVPRKYRWIAIQPWGELVVFTKKPRITDDDIGPYWDVQKDEISVTDFSLKLPWKQSLQKL